MPPFSQKMNMELTTDAAAVAVSALAVIRKLKLFHALDASQSGVQLF